MHQAIRNFCRALTSQIKYIKTSHRQPSLTQIQLHTAKLLQTATDQRNRSQQQRAKFSSLLQSWSTIHRCRTSHLSQAPRGHRALQPDTHISLIHCVMPKAEQWAFSFPCCLLSLPALGCPNPCGFHPRPKPWLREFKEEIWCQSSCPPSALHIIILYLRTYCRKFVI